MVAKISNAERMSRINRRIKAAYQQMSTYAELHGVGPNARKPKNLSPVEERFYNKLVDTFDRLVQGKTRIEYDMQVEMSDANLKEWGLELGDVVYSTAYAIPMYAMLVRAKQGHVVMQPIYDEPVNYPVYPITLHGGIIDKVKFVRKGEDAKNE